MLNPHWTGPPIIIKTRDQAEACRAAGQVVIKALEAAGRLCRSGISTGDLDRAIAHVLSTSGATGLFRGYRQSNSPPFPADSCISVNDEVVHGIPGNRVLRAGDLVSIDVGVRLNGYCGDSAVSFLVPLSDRPTASEQHAYRERAQLIHDTRLILDEAIAMIRPGRRWSEIGLWMEQATQELGYDLITEFVGHGIGADLHEPPKVPCYWSGFIGQDFILEPGMILAIEPMLVLTLPPDGVGSSSSNRSDQGGSALAGRASITTAPDGWTIRTESGAVACHEEFMVLVRECGPEVLTAGTPRVDYLGLVRESSATRKP